MSTNKLNLRTYAKLNVKQKSLAVESRIIKHDGKKYQRQGNTYIAYELFEHLTTVVKPEARATQLAIAFMKGKPYSSVEQKRKPEKEAYFTYYTLSALLRILKKYHNKDITLNEVREWCKL